MIEAVPYFKELDFKSKRAMVLKMKKRVVYEGKTLSNYREISDEIIFVL
jgi:hypothetical protein